MTTRAELEYGLVDVTAKEDATLSVNTQKSWTNIYQMHTEDKEYGKYTTFEGGGFVLDGTVDFFPDTPASAQLGWWSNTLSDANGAFATPPTLTVQFSTIHTSGGVTLWFSVPTLDWASEVTITWYDASGATMDTKTFYPTKGRFYCENQVENYQGLKLVFAGTNKPYHYLKVAALEYGMLQTFTEGGDELISAQILEQVDLLSDIVSVNTLNFSFHSIGNTFDLLNPTGAHVLFQQKQWVRVVETLDGEEIPMGMYYLEEVETKDNVTSMSCEDMLGVIDKTDYAGGEWESITARTLIAEIMTSAKAGSYVLDSSLASVTLTGSIGIMTHREALQQVAFALMATVNCERDGLIHIRKLPTDIAATVTPYDKVAGQTVKQSDLITAVEVYQGTTSDDTLIGSYYASDLPAQAKDNVLSVYVTLYGDAQALAKHIYDVSQLRLTAAGEWFPTKVAAGELVDVLQATGNTLTGFASSMDIALTDGFLAKTEVVGNAKSKFNL